MSNDGYTAGSTGGIIQKPSLYTIEKNAHRYSSKDKLRVTKQSAQPLLQFWGNWDKYPNQDTQPDLYRMLVL